jgi:hypothetical protein
VTPSNFTSFSQSILFPSKLKLILSYYSSSYEDLLNKSRLPTLKIRRLRTMAIEVYKILNKKSPMYLNDLFVYKESRYSFKNELNKSILLRFTRATPA